MRQRIVGLWKNDLIRGSSIFFAGNMLVNFGGFLYHLIMARMLGKVEYGILGSLLGLLYLASVPMGALDIFISKVVSSFGEDDILASTRSFTLWVLKKVGIALFILFPVLFLLAYPVSHFLHLDGIFGVVSVWIIVYLSIISIIFSSTLRGLLQFTRLVINLNLTMFIRLGLAVILVFLFKSYLGAQLSIILSMALGIGIFIWQMQFVWTAKKNVNVFINNLDLKKLGLGSLLLAGSFTAMASVDIILVRHFLTQELAGIYAAISTAGKVIFYATAPLGSVLLPVVARKIKHPEKARQDLWLTISIIGALGSIITGIYFLIPNFIVNILFSTNFSESSQYLFLAAIMTAFFSLANLLASYLLALGKTRAVLLPTFAVLCQIILLWIFHANLWEVLGISTFVFFGLTVVLLAQSLYVTRPIIDNSSSL